jgi:hypothetical protein
MLRREGRGKGSLLASTSGAAPQIKTNDPTVVGAPASHTCHLCPPIPCLGLTTYAGTCMAQEGSPGSSLRGLSQTTEPERDRGRATVVSWGRVGHCSVGEGTWEMPLCGSALRSQQRRLGLAWVPPTEHGKVCPKGEEGATGRSLCHPPPLILGAETGQHSRHPSRRMAQAGQTSWLKGVGRRVQAQTP